jgi:hypothetical protein
MQLQTPMREACESGNGTPFPPGGQNQVPTSAHYRFPCSSTKLFFKLFNYLLNTSFSSILLNIFVLKFFLHVFTNFELPDTVNGLLPPTVAPISSADHGRFQKVLGQQTIWAAPERISASSSGRTGRTHNRT